MADESISLGSGSIHFSRADRQRIFREGIPTRPRAQETTAARPPEYHGPEITTAPTRVIPRGLRRRIFTESLTTQQIQQEMQRRNAQQEQATAAKQPTQETAQQPADENLIADALKTHIKENQPQTVRRVVNVGKGVVEGIRNAANRTGARDLIDRIRTANASDPDKRHSDEEPLNVTTRVINPDSGSSPDEPPSVAGILALPEASPTLDASPPTTAAEPTGEDAVRLLNQIASEETPIRPQSTVRPWDTSKLPRVNKNPQAGRSVLTDPDQQFQPPSRIISRQPAPPPPPPVPTDVEVAKTDESYFHKEYQNLEEKRNAAKQFLRSVQEEAERILAKARSEAEAIKQATPAGTSQIERPDAENPDAGLPAAPENIDQNERENIDRHEQSYTAALPPAEPSAEKNEVPPSDDTGLLLHEYKQPVETLPLEPWQQEVNQKIQEGSVTDAAVQARERYNQVRKDRTELFSFIAYLEPIALQANNNNFWTLLGDAYLEAGETEAANQTYSRIA